MSGQFWIRRKPDPCTCCEGFQTNYLAFPVMLKDGQLVQGGIYDCAEKRPPSLLTDEQERTLRDAIARTGDRYDLIPHTGHRP